MAIEFRPWADGDDLTLLQLWGDPDTFQASQFRAALAPSSDASPWRRCIVAEDVVDGVAIPVAAGVVYDTSLHSQRLWAYVEVAKDHRRAGLGATLVTMLRREAEQSPSGVTALRSKVEPGTAGAEFAAALGLKPIQSSRMVRVQPAPLPLPRFGDGSEDAATDLVQDLATGSVELTDVVGRYYEFIHSWDPTGPLTAGTVQRLFLNDLTGAHGAVVLRQPAESAFGSSVPTAKKGKIRSFAVSYPDPQLLDAPARVDPADADSAPVGQPSEVFLGHEPALDAAEAQRAVAELLALIAHQHPVLVEYDDDMAALGAVLKPLLGAGRASVTGPETLIVAD